MKHYIRVNLLLLITIAALLTACGGGGGGSPASGTTPPVGTATATWDSAIWDDPGTTWSQ
jgi:hypothetical protein